MTQRKGKAAKPCRTTFLIEEIKMRGFSAVMVNSFQHPYQMKTTLNEQPGFRVHARNDNQADGFMLCRHPELVSESSKKKFTFMFCLNRNG